MPLNDDDVREILRIIDESELDELSIETEGFSLHVRKGAPVVGGALSESVRGSTLTESAPPPRVPSVHPSAPGPAVNGLETIRVADARDVLPRRGARGGALRGDRRARSDPRRPCASSRS